MSSPESQAQRLPDIIPVIGSGDRGVAAWLDALRASGFHLVDAGPDGADIQARLKAFSDRHPDRPALLLFAGMSLSARDALRLQEAAGHGDVVMALSNARPEFNPFAGLQPAGAEGDPAALVAWLGTGQLLPTGTFSGHATWLTPSAVRILVESGCAWRHAGQALADAGLSLHVADTVFVHQPDQALNLEPSLEPHEEPQPPVFGTLAARLSEWLTTAAPWPTDIPGDQPATLHVTHSWGGGVAQWVEAWSAADHTGPQLLLRSEGPQSGHGTGQRLALYRADAPACPLASWWLQPAIEDCVDHHPQYQALFDLLLQRYGVGRVIVSSLVGHSLDCLCGDRPTLQVLHDLFPTWPLLSVDPTPYARAGQPLDVQAALDTAGDNAEFPARNAASWAVLRDAWVQAIQRHDISLVAPTGSVASGLATTAPDCPVRPQVIAHGLPPLDGLESSSKPLTPRQRQDGRLRLLVPGRMQRVKGRDLLLKALPQITKFAQVTLFGAGKSGEYFHGISGVDIITEYQRDTMVEDIRTLAPHAALMLSIVPETFSYTLSEMQALGVPCVATRLGAFAERIDDGSTGWLIEPTAEALVEQVRRLAEHPDLLDGARAALAGVKPSDMATMIDAYAPLVAPSTHRVPVVTGQALADSGTGLAWSLAATRRELAQSRDRTSALTDELERRTRWATDREHALRQQQAATDAFRKEAERLHTEHQSAQRAEALARSERDQLADQYQRLEQLHEQVLASHSWRLTRPLRVARRILARARMAGALNPLRWPMLVGHMVRNVRMLGWRDAIYRLQFFAPVAVPDGTRIASLPGIGEDSTPITLRSAEQPVASIVIPVHNKWAYTAACLRSLQSARCRTPFEVIVVDDQSSDETAEKLSELVGITVLTNPENLGFIGSCNRGAESARAPWLVLLNNDTQVTDDWLDALLDTLQNERDAELVGARLVYPDGTLQESGGIVFRDGSGWNYGRGGDATAPPYNFVREVDYCSGACIALATERFRALGGFDRHYAPAYYEDTDLAFQLRNAGGRVLVAPHCTVVHHEGISSGTDLQHGVKRYQVVNSEKFRNRWAEALQQQPAPISNPDDDAAIIAARDHRLKGRVLVIDAHTPEPDQDSGSMRLVAIMQCLRELGYGVSFMPDNRAYAGRYTDALQHAGIECWHAPHATALPAFFSEHGSAFDVIFISRHYVAQDYLPLLKRHCPDARFIFDTVDLHYLREQRLAELENSDMLRRSAARTRRSELAVIQAADAVTVVSEAEIPVLAADAPGANVHVLSNIHSVQGCRAPFSDRKDLFFVGGYQHPPNIDAAEWFCAEIWPLVRQQLPGVRFHLIGSKAPDRLKSLASDDVVFHGFVEDLQPFLDGCRMAVAPLRYGAGVKGKVNMSMSHGQPVVATTMAVEGMYGEHGRDVLVADSAEDFAAEIVRLYQDEALWNRISAAAIKNVQQHFSADAARRALAAILDSLDR